MKPPEEAHTCESYLRGTPCAWVGCWWLAFVGLLVCLSCANFKAPIGYFLKMVGECNGRSVGVQVGRTPRTARKMASEIHLVIGAPLIILCNRTEKIRSTESIPRSTVYSHPSGVRVYASFTTPHLRELYVAPRKVHVTKTLREVYVRFTWPTLRVLYVSHVKSIRVCITWSLRAVYATFTYRNRPTSFHGLGHHSFTRPLRKKDDEHHIGLHSAT